MFRYSLLEPLKSVNEKKRAFSCPSSAGREKMRGSEFEMSFPLTGKWLLFLLLLFSVASSVVFWERNLTGLIHYGETVI